MLGQNPPPMTFPMLPTPPCPPQALDPSSGRTVELVEYEGKCVPRYVFSCPPGYYQINPVTGQCINMGAPLQPGVEPEMKGNPALPFRIRQPYLFWGIIGSVLVSGFLLSRTKR